MASDAGVSAGPAGTTEPGSVNKGGPQSDIVSPSALIYFDDYDYVDAWVEMGQERIRVRKVSHQGVIDAPSKRTIEVAHMKDDFPVLRKHFAWMEGEKLMPYQAMVGKITTEIGAHLKAGPNNRPLLPHVKGLLSSGVIEACSRRGGARGRGVILNAAFSVKKKKPGHLRFILSCRKLNKMLKSTGARIPPCRLPSYREIVDRLMTCSFFREHDFKSYFFQFELDERVRDLFAFRVGPKKYRMRRWPMGYGPVPQVSQAVSETLAVCATDSGRGVQVTWLDNVVLGAMTRADLLEMDLRFQALCERYGITIGESSEAGARGQILGMEIDLEAKRWRLSPEWIQKTVAWSDVLDFEGSLPLRLWWRLIGSCLWRRHALSQPIRRMIALLRWMSEVAKAELQEGPSDGNWDRLVYMGEEARSCLRAELTLLRDNEWQKWSSPPEKIVDVVSDASLTAWAFVFQDKPTWSKFEGSWATSRTDIFRKEAFAAARAIEHVLATEEGCFRIRIGIDNSAVIAAFTRAYTLNMDALEAIDKVLTLAAERGCVVEPYWVPTDKNIADKYTRLDR